METKESRRENERTTLKKGEVEREKHKAKLGFQHTLFSDLLKFIILSLLSHTQDPFSASIILSTNPIPLFTFKLHCFLSQSKWLLHRCGVCFFNTPPAAATTTTDKHLSLLLLRFSSFPFFFSALISVPTVTKRYEQQV